MSVCVCVSLCVSERANLTGSLLGSESEGRVLRVTFAHSLEKEKLKKKTKETGQQVDRSNIWTFFRLHVRKKKSMEAPLICSASFSSGGFVFSVIQL